MNYNWNDFPEITKYDIFYIRRVNIRKVSLKNQRSFKILFGVVFPYDLKERLYVSRSYGVIFHPSSRAIMYA